MKKKTQGWGDSVIATKYVYERVQDILNKTTKNEICYDLSRLSDELAHNYKIDTNKLIGDEGAK